MAEYIEREAAIAVIHKWLADIFGIDEVECTVLNKRLNAIPAADVVPVVHGRWEWNDNNGYYYCDKCGSISPREDQDGEYCDCPNYCPNCGASMREPPKEETE